MAEVVEGHRSEPRVQEVEHGVKRKVWHSNRSLAELHELQRSPVEQIVPGNFSLICTGAFTVSVSSFDSLHSGHEACSSWPEVRNGVGSLHGEPTD